MRPAFADLVVIITTPLAPLAPYIAVAEASLSTSIDSISEDEISEILSIGNPSTMNRGLLSCVIEPPPRTRICTSASGAPSATVTCTPAIRPARADSVLAIGIDVSALPFTDDTEPVRSRF